MPRAVKVTAFGLDPSNTCGDDPSAATKDYTLETSPDGAHWTLAKRGTFTPANLHKLNLVAPDAGAVGVRYVRLRTLTPQSAEDGDSGVDFIDFSEVEVYGDAQPTGSLTATPASVKAGGTVTLTAAFTDSDADAITSYSWDPDGNGTIDRTTTTPSTTFAYPTGGTFRAAVTATDARGAQGRATTPVTVQAKGTSKPKLATLPKSGRKGKLTFKVTCLTRCRLTASLTMSKALKRKLGLKKARVTRISRSIRTTGARRITLRVPKSVRRAANRHHVRTLKLKLAVSARTADGKRSAKHRTVRIRL
jgi:hypothetical protein